MKDNKKKKDDAKRKIEELSEKDYGNAPGKETAPQPKPYNPEK